MDKRLGPNPATTYAMPFLKYLFDVEFTDGSFYTQNALDRSEIDPAKRSCFYDVMQAVEGGKKIKHFMLSDGKDVYMVDLTDGHFEINRKKFFMHELRDLKDFRIIFFRQHTVSFLLGVTELNYENSGDQIVYRLGWQVNDETGANLQRVMEID